jgi:uncharacterized protein with PQ loop repeat
VPLVLSLVHAHPAARTAVPAVAELCGWLAGSIGVVTGWPQVWRLWVGRRHEGLSLSSNVLGVLYGTAWLLYGFARHSLVQECTCLLGLVVLIAILAGHLHLTRPTLRQWLPLLVAGWAGLAVMFVLGARPLGLAAAAATITGIAPQVVLLAGARRAGRTEAAGVSRPRWVMSCAANVLWVTYGAFVHDPVIFFNSMVIALLGAAIYVLAVEREPALVEVFEPEYAIAA